MVRNSLSSVYPLPSTRGEHSYGEEWLIHDNLNISHVLKEEVSVGWVLVGQAAENLISNSALEALRRIRVQLPFSVNVGHKVVILRELLPLKLLTQGLGESVSSVSRTTSFCSKVMHGNLLVW